MLVEVGNVSGVGEVNSELVAVTASHTCLSAVF